ncbi:HAD family hydrolase [Paenibacillus sp. SI8]|uniref:HAD family hydrolase n=1 Tax=unclassified Paenibacillus TaxID=185978 RepID=UPI003466E977
MNRHHVEAVIFDMDGVLVDTEPLYFQIEKDSFRHFGIDVDESEHHGYVGVTLENMWQQIIHRHGLATPLEEVLLHHKSNVVQFITAYADLQPIVQVESWIQWLQERDIPITVASSSSIRLIDIILNKAGLKPYFPNAISGEQVMQGKPAPDIFLHAAAELGIAPSRCLVIEDSHHGVKAAKAAGMLCIGYQNPGSGLQDLSEADFRIRSYEEMRDVTRHFSWKVGRQACSEKMIFTNK